MLRRKSMTINRQTSYGLRPMLQRVAIGAPCAAECRPTVPQRVCQARSSEYAATVIVVAQTCTPLIQLVVVPTSARAVCFISGQVAPGPPNGAILLSPARRLGPPHSVRL
jgi:hypothetical protein